MQVQSQAASAAKRASAARAVKAAQVASAALVVRVAAAAIAVTAGLAVMGCRVPMVATVVRPVPSVVWVRSVASELSVVSGAWAEKEALAA
jgi:hypothetical protein